jgi:hypothetical protein
MRMAIGFLVLLVLTSSAAADPAVRAQAVIDALGVDELTADKLFDILFRYDLDLARLERQKIELKRRMVLAQRKQLDEIETLLDDTLDNQRALATNEEQMLKRVRNRARAPRRLRRRRPRDRVAVHVQSVRVDARLSTLVT